MTQFEQLDLLLNEYGGIIQTFQVIDNGISKPVFYSYVKERGLEQAAHGVYVSPDTWTDAMYILHLRCSQAVFSHETALFFHDLTDREPLKYTITVRTGYNPSRLQENGFQVYTIKKDLHETGITTMQTPFGHSVPVYDMERTVCDLLRSRNNKKDVRGGHEIFQAEGLVVDFTGRTVTVDGKRVEMSPKEYELLFYLVRNRNIALDREKLITEVWGYDYYGDDRTLDTHIKLLRSSLGEYRKFLVTLRGVGYRFEA